MRLYLLKYNKSLEHCWDCLREVVVRAKNAREARKLVQEGASGDEDSNHPDGTPWLDKNYTSCRTIPSEGKPEIIVADVKEG